MGNALRSSRAVSCPAAPGSFPLLLIFLTIAIGLIDCFWAAKSHFAVAGPVYVGLAAITGLFWAGGYIYGIWRPEPRISAMLFGAGFLIGFTAGASVLNSMLLTVVGPRIDMLLAKADIALGFDWPGMMRAVANHPVLLKMLYLAYGVLLPEISLAVVVLGTLGRIASLYRFVLAVAIGALICFFIWTLFPAFGAMSVYHFDPALAARLGVLVDGAYGDALVGMLRDGPGPIAPDNVKGLIGFPSYHAVLALLLIWHLRDVRWLRWPVLALNIVVIFATPIEGGHHWVDVLAAVPVTALSILLARRVFDWTAQMDRARLVAQPMEKRTAPAV
ncbi:MAG: phosphatase PAP2 family protein [Pseudomonadota bacterium]